VVEEEGSRRRGRSPLVGETFRICAEGTALRHPSRKRV